MMRAIVLGLCLASLATAATAGPWVVRDNAAEVGNNAGSLTLSIFCGGDGAMVRIVHRNAPAWTAGQPVELTVGGETFALKLFRETENAGVFNLKPLELKPAMVAALRAGADVVLGGAAVAAIGDAERLFSLDGSGAALDQVGGGCAR